MYPVMVNGIRASDPRGLNKIHSLKFRVGSRVQQETPEEGQRTQGSKCCEYNNKDEDNSPKTLNDKNHQASSRKLRPLIPCPHQPPTGSDAAVSVVMVVLNPIYIYIYTKLLILSTLYF